MESEQIWVVEVPETLDFVVEHGLGQTVLDMGEVDNLDSHPLLSGIIDPAEDCGAKPSPDLIVKGVREVLHSFPVPSGHRIQIFHITRTET